jgi:hypothetical protein
VVTRALRVRTDRPVLLRQLELFDLG